MLLFKRRQREPAEIDLWGPNFSPRRVPLAADAEELDRLVLRLQALTDIRSPSFQLDHARAILAVIERGRAGEIYNVGGGNERHNIDVTYAILDLLGASLNHVNQVVLMAHAPAAAAMVP